MNDFVSQFLNLLRSLPLSKKISMAFVLCLVVAGFVLMFLWANQVDYQVLFNNLAPEDGGAIILKLKDGNIPYRVDGNGTIILVPAERVNELRLAMASDGLPTGGNLGFEIFDNTDFRTTRFVQELNYRRALQGELARTINQFKEIKSSRVFIVLSKESLFLDNITPATASIQLDLKSSLPPSRLAAIIHLVANAVEGLEPGKVTVVDTKGRVIFKGGNQDEATALVNNAQLDYRRRIENEIGKNVQTMLEGIVGSGKAIVRVNAEIDFNRTTLNEEEYDPQETAVRSMRNIEESTGRDTTTEGGGETSVNQRRGVLSGEGLSQSLKSKRDVTTNYEINKITRQIFKPAGEITRLSVAAVIDGTYQSEKLEDGTTRKTYVPRSDAELRTFQDIVRKAMGYSEDREDQVSVSSVPFSEAMQMETPADLKSGEFDIPEVFLAYKKTIINIFLVILVFFLVVRPLLKGLRRVSEETTLRLGELPAGGGQAQIPESGEGGRKERVLKISNNKPEKTQQLLKGWINE
jgi:flagellar M-ring protein FliF